MTAPAPTARGTPAGSKPGDGFRIKITFLVNPTIEFWEKSVTPMGWDGGEGVDTTTQFNTTYETMRAGHLMKATPAGARVTYDPLVMSAHIQALINVETTITETNPDGSTVAYFGYLKSFKPSAVERGKQPEADLEIQPTHYDPVAKVEAGPVYTAPT